MCVCVCLCLHTHCLYKQAELNMIHYCILSARTVHTSVGSPAQMGICCKFLQYSEFQPCCSTGSHYLEIINAVPLFSFQGEIKNTPVTIHARNMGAFQLQNYYFSLLSFCTTDSMFCRHFEAILRQGFSV